MTLYTHPIHNAPTFQSLPLTYDQRLRSRLFLHRDQEDAAHIILPRGLRLHTGLQIQADNGSVLRIESAGENISLVEAQGQPLARAAYHLGQRQIPAAITAGGVSWQRDPVIDAMMEGLGFTVVHKKRPFEPEPGVTPRERF